MIKGHQHFDLFDKLIFERVLLKPPMRAAGIMPHEACFIYAVNGNSEVMAQTQTVSLATEEGVLLKCGNFFNQWKDQHEDEVCEAIGIHFYPEVLRKIYDKELPEFLRKPKADTLASIRKVKANTLLKNYMESLKFYFDNPELVSEELLKLKVKELILLLAKTDSAEDIHDLISTLFTPTDYSFKEIIEANIYNNLNNEELAMLCNLSLSSFKREFDRIYQCSPAKFFKQRKLNRAAELLRHTHNRIGDIAYECGFVEISHFSRSFHKEFGVSPSVYRTKAVS